MEERSGWSELSPFAATPTDFSYWAAQSGEAGSYEIDPAEDAASLFEVARRVGAL